ncbi:HAMP domain-containing sensor histidine kinase [Corallococcus silvisoli]|uniref:HAMP domain-containing sensor histidine kinase n=1 Tax=Corallococcus silvisoli TaxID=2697031 RepID=UPI00137837AC|nr:ATP-binding protein [Corallococcus silvisoli]NBD08406.1 HAMP domain-containing protein [Corallococcus silvisoli]
MPMPRHWGLRARFLVACVLLVLTTVSASLWTLATLTRLSGEVGATVKDSDEATAATARLGSALEREDDALLLALTGDDHALGPKRQSTDEALAQLAALLTTRPEHQAATLLREEVEAYRDAANRIAAGAGTPDALGRYHREANPLLRHAAATTLSIRDHHFDATRQVARFAHEESIRALRVVLTITVVALLTSALLALHLARSVILPLRRLTRGAETIRRGEFGEAIPVESGDELGQLASAFNQMATDLAEFRRSKLGEVLQAKAALEATLEALPDAVVLLDVTGRVLSANRSAHELLIASGIPSLENIHELTLSGFDPRAVLELASSPHSAPPLADLGRALRITRDERIHRLLPRVVPVPSLSAERDAALLLLYDVTELVRLDEMRAELVAVASHELGTPLTTLRMTLLMLQESAASLSPRNQELVRTSLGGVEQLAETVDEFLDLTRIEAGQLKLSREHFSPAALASECVRRCRARTEDDGPHVELSVEGAPSTFWADPVRLRVVLDNLLSNALKYTPSTGQVRLTVGVVSQDGQRTVRISVTDNGPGVPEEFRERIFDKFFRVEHHRPGTEAGTRGSGIGLYLCRQIVELHGGSIRCQQGDDGGGACFLVSLPAADARA